VPTVLRDGPYRFFFFSNEGGEPPHVHVRRERAIAKFWLKPVALASAVRFDAVDLGRLWKMVEERQGEFLEAWNAHFSE
jgi:hypothetical protein